MHPILAWFVLPVNTTSVQSLVSYPLLTPPYSDTTLFPKGFPANAHPVLVSAGYMNDIRMANLQIPSLKQGSVYIPYTDRLKNGKTAFNYVSSSVGFFVQEPTTIRFVIPRRLAGPMI